MRLCIHSYGDGDIAECPGNYLHQHCSFEAGLQPLGQRYKGFGCFSERRLKSAAMRSWSELIGSFGIISFVKP
jgi:hypothetical protein